MIAIRRFDKKTWNFLYNEVDILVYVRDQYGAYFRWGNGKSPLITLPKSERHLDSHMWSSLLHETGHYKDYKYKGEAKFRKMGEDKSQRLDLEIMAWKLAIKLSKKYKIDIDPEISLSWLNSYDVTWKPLERMVADRRRRV